MALDAMDENVVLSNGVNILAQSVRQTPDEIVLEFECDRAVGARDVADLYTPGSNYPFILDELTRKGWISADFISLVHFRMNIDVDRKAHKIMFRYYKPTPPKFTGGQMDTMVN